MSNECSTVVWKRDFGSLTRKVIAARLADHADDEGRGIWPSVERVAAQCNASIRTVQRTLAEFVEQGILKIISEGGRGPGSTTRYDFDMRVLEALPLASWGPDAQASNGQNKGDTVSPLENHKGDTDDAKGDSDDRKGCHPVTQTSIEPSEPSEGESEGERDALEGEKTDRAETGVKAIEAAYWKLVKDWPGFAGMPKEPGLKVWMTLSDDDRAAAISGFPGWLELVRKRDHKPAPSTYFRERLWADVPVKPQGAATVEAVAAFGKAGMAYRLWILNQPEKGHPAPTAFVAKILAAGGKEAEAELLNRRAAYSWPRLVELDRRTLEREHIRVAPEIAAMGSDFVSTDLGGPVGEAWKRLFKRMRMPWLPALAGQPDWPKYAYLPAVGSDHDELDKAVAAAWWQFAERCKGHADAA